MSDTDWEIKPAEERLKAVFAAVRQVIEENEVAVVGNNNEDMGTADCSFTMGMHEHGLPELLCFGGNDQKFGAVVNKIAQRAIKAGRRYKDGEILVFEEYMPGAKAKIIDTRIEARLWTFAASDFYGHADYEVQQIILSDRNGKFITEEGSRIPPDAFPLLTVPPVEDPGEWSSAVGAKDDFGEPISNEIIDGMTEKGSWALMSPFSWYKHGNHGEVLSPQMGTGLAQRYKKNEAGRWIKVEG